MKQYDVQIALEGLREAREKWGRARTEFFSGYDYVLSRLIYEAARNYMGVAQIATALGVGQKTVRTKMRSLGLDPRAGKRTLNAGAAEALAENSALLGIEPHEMDLTSPLAYLPMGEQLRKELRDKTTSQVTELPDDVSGNDYEVAKDRIESALYLGIDVEGIPVSRSNVPDVAAWLASEGIK